MTDDADNPLTPEQQERYAAWFVKARGLHRNLRFGGYIACAAGIGLMLWSRFGGGPEIMLPVGVGVIVAGWALFGWVAYARFQWVKNNPFDPDA
jgi:hypothetical protein